MNWRELGLEGTELKVQLPCKPDRTSRQVRMGADDVQLNVAGCEAQGAVWAVMTGQVSAQADRQALLQGWRQATLANMRSSAQQEMAWAPKRGNALTTLRLVAQGTGPDNKPVTAQAVWLAYVEGSALRWLHAVVYQDRADAQAADLFFESIALP
ncbi:MAG: hypothetical protein EBQ86_09000 [Betaproteobacteria bacterium]|nr:hypothetical protein [Betaproteobacteria bacterium]